MNHSASLRYFSVFFLFCFGCKSFSQDLHVNLKKIHASADSSDYSLAVFNNLSKPIGIKVSAYFWKFSNVDTLPIAIGEYSNTNGKDYYFGIDRSVRDGQGSEPGPYHLFILNPQTYLLTNLRLTDLNNYQNKSVWFRLSYLDSLTGKDSVHLGRTDINLTRDFNRPFKDRNIRLN